MRVVIYGSRPDGHANVVLELLARRPAFEVVGLIDDWPENAKRRIGSLKVIGGIGDLANLAAERQVEGILLGFGAAKGRGAIVEAIDAAGLELPTLVHPLAHVAPSATLEPGVQVLPYASVGPHAHVGRGGLVNTGAIVEHDVRIEAYSVIDPGAVLAGRVQIAEEVEVGSGATVIPDIKIGRRAMIGAGAVVVGSVSEGETFVGVPAGPINHDRIG